MGPFEMVVGIVLIVTVANIVRMKYNHKAVDPDPILRSENARLAQELVALKERVQVLERITVEKENSLERQIEQLRDR